MVTARTELCDLQKIFWDIYNVTRKGRGLKPLPYPKKRT
jgi:hypothetical protein